MCLSELSALVSIVVVVVTVSTVKVVAVVIRRRDEEDRCLGLGLNFNARAHKLKQSSFHRR